MKHLLGVSVFACIMLALAGVVFLSSLGSAQAAPSSTVLQQPTQKEVQKIQAAIATASEKDKKSNGKIRPLAQVPWSEPTVITAIFSNQSVANKGWWCKPVPGSDVNYYHFKLEPKYSDQDLYLLTADWQKQLGRSINNGTAVDTIKWQLDGSYNGIQICVHGYQGGNFKLTTGIS